MKALNFLILTDHRGHSDQNSLYALTQQLVKDARTAAAFVASRGDARNAAFFAGDLSAPIYGLVASQAFSQATAAEEFLTSQATSQYAEADVIWLRLPPPADRGFFAALSSFAPASAPKKAPVIINNPEGIIETGSKAFLQHFTAFTAPIWSVTSGSQIQELSEQHALVLKPLREYGGRGLVRILEGFAEEEGLKIPLGEWLEKANSTITSGAYLAMKYLKNVSAGDKRILVVNGRILGASVRVPAPGQWLCNVSQGGTSLAADIAPEEEKMIAAVAPVLLNKGVVIFGADTLVDDDGKRVLSELNTNSIGGFPQAEAQSGRPVLQQTINGIYDYLAARL
ncbi:RimK family alpha-L-glutamate ligase [Lewinella sp. 4G2]|uniref:ATP-grasp domain-containing protein n=1 Tax=Lewinella sp. 4G2 TaxID=1803372 RepID=UPI0007B4753C|nr:hypothetical protein [Lewinella sp. 4G2]OAV44941.1 hypothetical protein A3850_010740 [Lewinella sp. 4G2]